MKKYSIGVKIAWQIASWEAKKFGYAHIEPEHILIGLCSLGKAAEFQEKISTLPPVESEQFAKEKRLLDKILSNIDTTAPQLRRAIRGQLNKSEKKKNKTVIHRSPEVKNYFELAENLAGQDEDLQVHHLFMILMDRPNLNISDALAGLNLDPRKLHAILFSIQSEESIN
jgi:ATP-dependent Clp protease ATP-binding subunit ClpA